MVMFVKRLGRHTARAGQATACRLLALGALVLLPGCESVEQFYSTRLPVGGAIDWWHGLQGGVIAQQRPPPPGASEPFPNLATVPSPPTPTDPATRRLLAARLASARDLTVRDAAQDPINSPPQPVPTTQAPPPATPMARLDAANALPAASAEPPAAREAPSFPIASPAAPAPAAAAPPGIAPPAIAPSVARPTQPAPAMAPATAPATAAGGPIPALPDEPPALPSLAGVPAAAYEPATPRPRPQVTVSFPPSSAELRPAAEDALRALAARRAGGPMAVVGGGDARSAAPGAQAAALPLAWRRAMAITAALKQAGVPDSALQTDASALARGGTVRLVE